MQAAAIDRPVTGLGATIGTPLTLLRMSLDPGQFDSATTRAIPSAGPPKPWSTRPLGLALALAIVASVVLLSALVVATFGVPTVGDLALMTRPVVAMSLGDLRTVMILDDTQVYTSPPLWPILIATLASLSNVSLTDVNTILGWAAWVSVPVAVAVTLATYQGRSWRSPKGLAAIAATAFSVPAATSLTEYWHPQDLAAFSFLLLALCALARRRPWLAGGLLGIALAARHLIILPALVVIVVAPRWPVRLRVVIGALAVPVVVSLRIFLANPRGFLDALRAQRVVRMSLTPAGRILRGIGASDATTWAVARLAPLLAAGIVVAVLVRHLHRLRRVSPTPVEDFPLLPALGGITSIFAGRMLFEPSPFVYYAAPLVALAALGVALTGRWPLAALGASLCFTALVGTSVRSAALTSPYSLRALGATASWAIAMGLCLFVFGRWWRTSELPTPTRPDPLRSDLARA